MALVRAVAPNRLNTLVIPEYIATREPLVHLTNFAKRVDERVFVAWMLGIFGRDVPLEAYLEFRKDLLAKQVELPTVVVVDDLPGGHEGAYLAVTRTVKVSRSLVESTQEDSSEARDQMWKLLIVIFEEFGHHVDNLLRNEYSKVGGDAAFDEGARLAWALLRFDWTKQTQHEFGKYYRQGSFVPLTLQWQGFDSAVQEWLDLDARSKDDKDAYHEFFEAGRGKEDKKGVRIKDSFGHRSIEEEGLRAVGQSGSVGYQFREKDLPLIYFGNWARDYSQICDAKVVKAKGSTAILDGIPRSTLTTLVEILALSEFGDKTHYKLNEDRLGVYQAHEHIDNPKGIESAAHIDPDFRDAVDLQELAIDPQRWMKNYIATPGSWDNSADYIAENIRNAIQEGESNEGRRLFGAALHTLEDYYAHSNFCELMLRELGHPAISWTASVSIAPHPPIFPVVTGSFAAADTVVSILYAVAHHMTQELRCEPGERSQGVKMALILLKDLDPEWAKTAGGVFASTEQLARDWPRLSTALCRTIGQAFQMVSKVLGTLVHFVAQGAVDAQDAYLDDPTSTDPTHSLLAKDHDDHPLHSLAAKSAIVAVRHVGTAMKLAWDKKISPDQVVATATQFLVHPGQLSPMNEAHVELRNLAQTWAKANQAKVADLCSISWAKSWARTHEAELKNAGGLIESAYLENAEYLKGETPR